MTWERFTKEQSVLIFFLEFLRPIPRFFAAPGRSKWSDGSFLLYSLVLVVYPSFALSPIIYFFFFKAF